MADNLFKNETLDEARERLREMKQQELQSFAAASEGQAIVDRNPPEMQERAAEVDEKYDPFRDFHVEAGTNRPASEGAEALRASGLRPFGERTPDEGEAAAGASRPPDAERAAPRRRRRARGAEGAEGTAEAEGGGNGGTEQTEG
jgi:hypothetical protein